jgi:hypothetical protein
VLTDYTLLGGVAFWLVSAGPAAELTPAATQAPQSAALRVRPGAAS